MHTTYTTITPQFLKKQKKEFIRNIVQFKDEETMLNHINEYLEFLKRYGIHFNHDIYQELKTYSTNDLYKKMLRHRVMDRDTFIMDINSLSDDDGIIDRIRTYLKEKYKFPSQSIQTNKKLIPSIYADLKKYIDDGSIINHEYKTAVKNFRKAHKIQQKIIEPVTPTTPRTTTKPQTTPLHHHDIQRKDKPMIPIPTTKTGLNLNRRKGRVIRIPTTPLHHHSPHHTKTETKNDGGLLVVMFVSGLVVALVATGISMINV
jgi:hypothetical protein